jgi:hypothetical protein
LDESPSQNFKRLQDVHDFIASPVNRGLCCSLFKDHLEVRKKFNVIFCFVLKKERDENVGKNSSFLSDTQYYFGMKKE